MMIQVKNKLKLRIDSYSGQLSNKNKPCMLGLVVAFNDMPSDWAWGFFFFGNIYKNKNHLLLETIISL